MSLTRKFAITLIAAAGLGLTQHVYAEGAPQHVLDRIEALKHEWAANPVLVEAVLAQNARNTPLSAIQQLDEQWRHTSGFAAFMGPVLDNPAAEELARLERDAGFVMESFVMDNQGALVAATNKTSDYWQGDEAKFTESFKGGQGAVHVGEVEFDSSAQKYLAQVSLPIMKDGKAIGAITIGVDVDAAK